LKLTFLLQSLLSATLFANTDPEGMHLGNPKTAPIFIKNFFEDWKSILHKKHGIKKYEKCDFEPIRRHLNEQKLVKKAITDEQRKFNKTERNNAMFQYGYALVDGHIEKVGNYNMEPPGAFRGRGEHPKMGKLKHRVDPEQVSLNVSMCASVPQCGVPGHAWGELRHDPQVQWLAKWQENINNQVKYMQLAAQSSFKGKSDRSKYSKAAQLCGNIDKIRASYNKKLVSKSMEERQLATAMWVIDLLALRVGGEKDTEEEADTVGCCSLRVEHLHFDPNGTEDDTKEIELEFLGKDSMLFKQTIDFSAEMYTENNGMGVQVYENFKKFCKKKKPTEEVFDSLTPTILNAHLKEIMEGLTAKVFRTYNASKTLQDELQKTEQASHWKRLTAAEKVVEYNNANRQVAILCNHQKSVSKAQETQLENIGEKIGTLKKQKNVLKKILKVINAGDESMMKKIPSKKDEKEEKEDIEKAVAKSKKMKDKAKTNEEKIAATAFDEETKQRKRDLTKMKFDQAHLWEKTPSKEQVGKKIKSWGDKIAKMEMDLKHKDDNKEVSLGTSKINYMDPRITVAWCKRNEVPIEKVFSKTLRDKFNWAAAVPPNWEFKADIGRQG
jgi:DNA topoisomerase-1